MNITEMIFNVVKTIYSIMIVVCSVGPMVNYVLSGEMVPALPIYLPGMNAETFAHFILIACVHSVIATVAACILYPIDTFMIAIFVNMLLVASIIVEDIRGLLHLVSQRKCALAESNRRLIEIVLMHTKYSE